MTVPASVSAILPALTEIILSNFGEIADRIILHGSATDETLFRPGSSDIDLFVLYSAKSSPHGNPGYAELRKYANTLSGPWTKIEITFINRERIERYRNFELCYEGRACSGLILYDANRPHTYPTLSREAARDEVSEQYMFRTWRWLSQDTPDSKWASWSACRAACSAFHAILIRHDIDISPKSFRWNLPALFAVATQYHPELNKLAHFVETLPVDLAPMDMNLFDNLPRDWDESENAKLLAASIRVARACGKIAGCKPTYRSLRKLLRSTN